MLSVVEIFYSLHGEGRFTGVPAVFIRLAGCVNICPWCDSKESWSVDRYPPMPVDAIATKASSFPSRIAVVTGGEPLLHTLDALCDALKQHHFRLHLETSGTAVLSGAWDWVCLSPKRHRPSLPAIYPQADELKVVIENAADFTWAEAAAAQVLPDCLLFMQPEWSCRQTVLPLLIDYIKQHPQWQLSLQTHKWLGIR
ncbi:MAG: 7-carboxy-7-deazaguanine synthase QueE [Prevotellaceae bacterium]|jgi:organic radical activating enzyme|nr:7-carboxy-7-deazaguanine synthase QueE [Prevotellaceae bacterium]